jgi:gluconolactonase
MQKWGKTYNLTAIRDLRAAVDLHLLDSLAVEAGGKVCVATIINGGITAFDEDGTTEHYPFPDILVTNICFGGADMKDAWITASGTGKLYKCRWPRPGLKLNYNA